MYFTDSQWCIFKKFKHFIEASFLLKLYIFHAYFTLISFMQNFAFFNYFQRQSSVPNAKAKYAIKVKKTGS